MTGLDDAINDLEKEEQRRRAKHVKTKPDNKRNKNLTLPMLILLACLVIAGFDQLTTWSFGIPDETIQSDITKLLQHTDEKIEQAHGATGNYPFQLPDDTPKWLIGYKRTLAGYKLNAEIDGVKVELEREGRSVKVTRVED